MNVVAHNRSYYLVENCSAMRTPSKPCADLAGPHSSPPVGRTRPGCTTSGPTGGNTRGTSAACRSSSGSRDTGMWAGPQSQSLWREGEGRLINKGGLQHIIICSSPSPSTCFLHNKAGKRPTVAKERFKRFY